jgi:hypothetical protein
LQAECEDHAGRGHSEEANGWIFGDGATVRGD